MIDTYILVQPQNDRYILVQPLARYILANYVCIHHTLTFITKCGPARKAAAELMHMYYII